MMGNTVKIFIINLKQDIQRKEYMQKLCDRYGLSVTFFEAIEGSKLSGNVIESVYLEEKTIKKIKRGLSKGEIGCVLSHKKIYQKMLDENIEKAVIFEDDIKFDKNLINFLNNNVNFPSNAELVLLGYWFYGLNKIELLISYRKQVQLTNGLKLVRFIRNVHGTYGYIVTLDGAKKLLNHLNKGIYMPIDHYTGNEELINLYGIYPPLIKLSDRFDVTTELEKERKKERIKYSSTVIQNKSIKNFFKKLKLFSIVKKIYLIYSIGKRDFFYLMQRLINKKDYE